MGADQPTALSYQRARFVTQLPLRYRYHPGHYWLAAEAGGIWRVGLTKFGTRMLGEVVDYGFEAAVGSTVAEGQVVGWIEGFKARADLPSVGVGVFVGGNPGLEADPTLIHQDPYDAGWLYALRGTPGAECVDAAGYAAVLDEVIDRFLKRSG